MRTRAPSKPILTKEPIDAGNHPVTVFDDILPAETTTDYDGFLESHWSLLRTLSFLHQDATYRNAIPLGDNALPCTLISAINALDYYRAHRRERGDKLVDPLKYAADELSTLSRKFVAINQFAGCSTCQICFLTALWERLCEVATDVAPGDIADQVRRMRKSWKASVIPLLSNGKNVEPTTVEELANDLDNIGKRFIDPLKPGIKLRTDEDVREISEISAKTIGTDKSPIEEIQKRHLGPLTPTTHKPGINDWCEDSTCADLDKSGRSRHTGKSIPLNHIENGASLKIGNEPNGRVHYTFTSPSFTREYTITRGEAIAFIDLLIDAALNKTYSVWVPKWVKKNGEISERRGDFQPNAFKDKQGKKSQYANAAEFHQDLITTYDPRYELTTKGKVRLGRPKPKPSE